MLLFSFGKMQQAHGIRPGMGFPDQMMYQQGPPQPWYGQQPPMQQPSYYSPQQPLPPGDYLFLIIYSYFDLILILINVHNAV